MSFSHLNDILSRQYSSAQARRLLIKFKTLVTVLAVTEKVVDLALSSEFKEFEDGLQYFTAIENKARLLLTRNLNDYKTAEITVMTAEQFLNG